MGLKIRGFCAAIIWSVCCLQAAYAQQETASVPAQEESDKGAVALAMPGGSSASNAAVGGVSVQTIVIGAIAVAAVVAAASSSSDSTNGTSGTQTITPSGTTGTK